MLAANKRSNQKAEQKERATKTSHMADAFFVSLLSFPFRSLYKFDSKNVKCFLFLSQAERLDCSAAPQDMSSSVFYSAFLVLLVTKKLSGHTLSLPPMLSAKEPHYTGLIGGAAPAAKKGVCHECGKQMFDTKFVGGANAHYKKG